MRAFPAGLILDGTTDREISTTRVIRDDGHIGHLQETGTADAINNGGPYESMRNTLLAPDFATQLQEMKTTGGRPDYASATRSPATERSSSPQPRAAPEEEG